MRLESRNSIERQLLELLADGPMRFEAIFESYRHIAVADGHRTLRIVPGLVEAIDRLLLEGTIEADYGPDRSGTIDRVWLAAADRAIMAGESSSAPEE